MPRAYFLCAQRFCRSPVFDRTFVQTLIAPCIADRPGTKVLCANFVANSILQHALFQCTKVLSRASQGHKVLSVILGLHYAMFDVHKGSIYTFLPELP